MNTEQIVKVSLAALIILGYGVVLVTYMVWGPTEPNRALDALIGGLSSGYLLVMSSLFGSSKT
jgi:hypothetical protein